MEAPASIGNLVEDSNLDSDAVNAADIAESDDDVDDAIDNDEIEDSEEDDAKAKATEDASDDDSSDAEEKTLLQESVQGAGAKSMEAPASIGNLVEDSNLDS